MITVEENEPLPRGKDEIQVQNREYSYAHVLNTSKNVGDYEVLKNNMARKVEIISLTFLLFKNTSILIDSLQQTAITLVPSLSFTESIYDHAQHLFLAP